MMRHHIFVTVQGGVAAVCEETVPAGIVVEILDFDNFAANPERELCLWSPLREYWATTRNGVAVGTIVPGGS
jgi:hypothetical protein